MLQPNIPYSRQSINQADIYAVSEVLKSPMLTTGPKISEFEQKFADKVGAKYAVAVSSGTAALHASVNAIGIKPGDEVIVPAMTFIATANAAKYQGGTVVFADVDKDALLIDPEDVNRKITNKTVGIIPVDYAGQHADTLLVDRWNIQDACHSLKHSNFSDMTCHSFHPVKHMTTGEGGMVTTNSENLANDIRSLRNHEGGQNYRMSDIQAALGISQLDRLDSFIARRQEIAAIYDEAFKGTNIRPLAKVSDHTYHLYVVRVPNRDKFRQKLADKGIGTQVHYKPVNLIYREPGCPVAEKAWEEIVSIPCYPDLTDSEIEYIIDICKERKVA